MDIGITKLLISIMFFLMAGYLYLYASGLIKARDASARQRQVELMGKEGKWLRPLCLALAAFSFIEICMFFLGM